MVQRFRGMSRPLSYSPPILSRRSKMSASQSLTEDQGFFHIRAIRQNGDLEIEAQGDTERDHGPEWVVQPAILNKALLHRAFLQVRLGAIAAEDGSAYDKRCNERCLQGFRLIQ